MTSSWRPAEQSLRDHVRLDFDLACAELALAKAAVRAEDTPATRARLRACRDRVDTVLDMRCDAGRSRG